MNGFVTALVAAPVLALPWVVAIFLVTRADRGSLLWTENGHAFPSQADTARFLGRR